MQDQLTLSQLRVQGLLYEDARDDGIGDSRSAAGHGRAVLDIPVPTPLDLDLELHVDLENAGRSDDPSQTVDLAGVVSVVKLIAEQGHWALLESLGLAIVRTLLLPPASGELRAQVDSLTLRIRKPAWNRAHATPGVVFHRASRWCTTERRVLGPGVAADVIADTRYTTLLRVRLTKGARWNLPLGAQVVVLAHADVRGSVVKAPSAPGALLVVHRK
jgi:dihydroneopterin aldolase